MTNAGSRRPARAAALALVGAVALAASPARAETRLNPTDGAELVWVAPGAFLMGSDSGGKEEAPAHTVTLGGYWIYAVEVTAGRYLGFVDATGRKPPSEPRYGFVENLPAVYVSWEDADAYCRWAGGQLPTEAQWEKAARGGDGRRFPWGDAYDRARAHVGPGVERQPKPVGSYPQGASPFGVLDMTGNVDEWVRDHYASDYYKGSPATDPPGPDRGQRVVRGGSFMVGNEKKLTTTTRAGKTATTKGDSTGFRCVVEGDG